jgi:ELWxxDGT repeat protein
MAVAARAPQQESGTMQTFFVTDDGVHGSELWITDGSIAGTRIVKDINPGSAASNPGSLTNVNGTLYFTANDGVHGPALWKSNGTAAGTVMLSGDRSARGCGGRGNLMLREPGGPG